MSSPRIEEARARLKPAPPEPPRALSPEQLAKQTEQDFVARLSRVKAVREARRRNAFQIDNQDSRFRYEWVENVPVEIAKKKLDGWEITYSAEGDPAAPQTPYRQPSDGAHVFRELILMQLPAEDYDVLELLPQLEAWERANGPAKYEDILAFAQEAGIPVQVREAS